MDEVAVAVRSSSEQPSVVRNLGKGIQNGRVCSIAYRTTFACVNLIALEYRPP